MEFFKLIYECECEGNLERKFALFNELYRDFKNGVYDGYINSLSTSDENKIKDLDFKSYAFNFIENRGFDYYYITIIPPTSLLIIMEKLDNLEVDKNWQDEIDKLKDKLWEAYKKNKYIIHYGI